jgi:hypothetical protein
MTKALFPRFKYLRKCFSLGKHFFSVKAFVSGFSRINRLYECFVLDDTSGEQEYLVVFYDTSGLTFDLKSLFLLSDLSVVKRVSIRKKNNNRVYKKNPPVYRMV